MPESCAAGVIITQGGTAGGWTLYAHQGKLKYCYCFFGMNTSPQRMSRSRLVSIRCGWRSPTTAAAWPRAATSALYYDGKPAGKGRVEQTQPMAFSADEACDVVRDTGSPASPDYGPTDNKFSGEIEWVQIEIGEDSHDHLITAEDRLKIAMAKQ